LATLFFSYSHKDEALRDQLDAQFAILKRQGVIEAWHDRRIGAGEEFAGLIDSHVNSDDIILLLVSPDFLASDYCYEREMERAMERHDGGEAIVIPVILRACDWHHTPFGKLNATPRDGHPITLWPDRDQAMLEVAQAVRAAAAKLSAPREAPTDPSAPAASDKLGLEAASSSNLQLAKRFTPHDRDTFKDEAFEFLAKFFERSLGELELRNPGVRTRFRRIHADRFTAVGYRQGERDAGCTIFTGSSTFGGIAFYGREDADGTAFNENLTVEADDQSLFLHSIGMATMFRRRAPDDKLSAEGAAELYWEMFIEPLQRR
jgi:hypothetical protein